MTQPQLARYVTERALPTASATAQLPRETYDRFAARAREMGTTKGTLLRKFVEEFLEK